MYQDALSPKSREWLVIARMKYSSLNTDVTTCLERYSDTILQMSYSSKNYIRFIVLIWSLRMICILYVLFKATLF